MLYYNKCKATYTGHDNNTHEKKGNNTMNNLTIQTKILEVANFWAAHEILRIDLNILNINGDKEYHARVFEEDNRIFDIVIFESTEQVTIRTVQ